MQQLQSAVTEQRTIWKSIRLIITLDSLYDNFEMILAPLLYSGDKNLEEIQKIITLSKVANLAK